MNEDGEKERKEKGMDECCGLCRCLCVLDRSAAPF